MTAEEEQTVQAFHQLPGSGRPVCASSRTKRTRRSDVTS
jgi:hypothetical protein